MKSNRGNLLNMYNNNSVMHYNNDLNVGLESIKAKLDSFSFKSIEYKFDNYDVQPMPI